MCASVHFMDTDAERKVSVLNVYSSVAFSSGVLHASPGSRRQGQATRGQ